ncbi:hypothetical protein [Photobacterium angustum]|uniref:hypothetical protein n=1 Tax=Photobacterium angustum TaxID=661 RepID=UPI0005E73779|nr:hypothetical protein [Photobacterium angustum]KJG19066.1 hypothetical protein UA33_03310 [Photobacterium angustum]KJG25244.1 hypothetical protein UA39_04660 [Photobacterium angustum]KJG33552.1 hypothetical protein UA36_00710 [Photobacterium angustum]PSW96045.1 hypothetical protein C0W79_08375 [Photobacterium angustum]PSX02820.1 hypothetical protein C0W87_06870 [Photobacterium angustum]
MDSINRTDQLIELVRKAGSIRKAERAIMEYKGVAPSKSAIDRAIKGSGTDYSLQCMIDDLTKALESNK